MCFRTARPFELLRSRRLRSGAMKSKAAGLFSIRTSNQKMFYRDVLETLNAAKIKFLVGGGHAFTMYSGTSRKTKDMDLFVRPADVEVTLRTLADKRYE